MLPPLSPSKLHHLAKHCSSLSHLNQILTQLLIHPQPSPSSFNSLIQSFTNSNLPHHSLLLFAHMTRSVSSKPDNLTYPFALKACALLRAVLSGISIHCRILCMGFQPDAFIRCSLIRMYFDFEEINYAYKVFGEMVDRDAVVWNSMIGGYVKCGRVEEAEELFETMNVMKNVGTYIAMLSGYVRMGCIQRARELFDEMLVRDVVSWNTMIGAQARLGMVEIACELFDRAPKKNVATWSTIISGFCCNGYYNDALDMFKKMLVDGLRPNQAILVCALSSCAHLGALELGVWIRGYIDQFGFEVDDWLGSSLIDMYSKCGLLQGAISLFHRLKRREPCTWTSMIHGYAIHGHCHQALDTFNKMEELRIKPNDVTFVAILSACSHAGLVDKGREIFGRMKQVYNMSPKIEHYTCMIDLFCRSNLLDEAQELVKSMPMKPDIYVWGALLSGLRIHQHNGLKLDNGLREEIERLRPTDSGLYVLLSNIYAGFDQWGEVEKMRGMMKGFGVKKNRGWSLIEVEGVVHEFLAGQREGNCKLDQVYEMLDCVYKGICISYFA